MSVKIGCDLVRVGRFEKSAKIGGFLEKILSASEISSAKNSASLAGMFAAKEAIIKALGMKAGDWQKIEIKKDGGGRPYARIADSPLEILSQDISISHDGDYAMAIAVFLIKNDL